MNFIDSLLDFENKQELYEFKFATENYLIWPFVRFRVLQGALNQFHHLEEAHAKKERLSLKSLLAYAFHTLKYSPFKYKNKNIRYIYFSTVAGNTSLKDNRYFNRLHDYFALVYPRESLVVEMSYRFQHRTPRYFPQNSFLDIIYIKSVLRALFKPVSSSDRKTVWAFIAFLKSDFPYRFSDDFYAGLEKYLLFLSRRLKFHIIYFKKLYAKLKPEMVFLNCASYGSEAYIIKTAKEAGVKVGEMQHGLISSNHPAYNYGDGISAHPKYGEYLPDYFLTYGKFWTQSIRLPVTKVEIGNPHFYSSIAQYRNKPRPAGSPHNLLVVSDGNQPQLFLEITREIARLLSGYRITFRLHPGEVPFKDARYSELNNYPNIVFNTQGDIYQAIVDSDTVVGCFSTVIYEALAFGKPVFIYDNIMSRLNIPPEIGVRFKTTEELRKLLTRPYPNPVAPEYIWETDWEKRFRDFISRL